MGWVGVDVDGAATSGALAWVRLDADGTDRVRGATPIAADHVASLGVPGPVIVDGTPYGREALLGEALRTIIGEAGADPLDALGLVHDDGADEYRLTLLVEAARLAGVAPDRVVLVPRSDGDDGARRAAGAALAMLPAAGAAGGAGAAAAAGIGGGAGAVGGVILGSHLLDGGAAAVAAGATAGPAGAALSGPTGAAMSGPVGPPLAGPTGQAAAGPAGTGAGPVGNVIVPVAQAASKAKWVPILGGAAVGVAAIVGVAVVAAGGDETPAEADAAVTVEGAPPVTTLIDPPAVTTSPTTTATTPSTTIAMTTTLASTTTSTTTTTAVVPVGDYTQLLGSWQTGCIEESGGSVQVVYTLSGASTDALSLHAAVTAYPGPGCSGTSQIYEDAIPASVTGTTVVDGLETFQIHTEDGNGIMAADGSTLYIGAFEDTVSYPTAFDPMWTCTRV